MGRQQLVRALYVIPPCSLAVACYAPKLYLPIGFLYNHGVTHSSNFLRQTRRSLNYYNTTTNKKDVKSKSKEKENHPPIDTSKLSGSTN